MSLRYGRRRHDGSEGVRGEEQYGYERDGVTRDLDNVVQLRQLYRGFSTAWKTRDVGTTLQVGLYVRHA